MEKAKDSEIVADDKKSFVSRSRLCDGQAREKRPEVKGTEIAKRESERLQQTFTGVFCGTCPPL